MKPRFRSYLDYVGLWRKTSDGRDSWGLPSKARLGSKQILGSTSPDRPTSPTSSGGFNKW